MISLVLETLKAWKDKNLINIDLDANSENHPIMEILVQSKLFKNKAFMKQEGFLLSVKDNHLCVLSGNQKPIFVDFSSPKIKSQILKTSRKSVSAKALGLKQNQKHLVDLTAGFGKDAFVISKYFSKITLVERNPIVFLLLQDGLKRLNDTLPGLALKFELIFAEAKDFLGQSKNFNESVLYFDFMFSDKKSKSNKEMAFLKHITHTDFDVNLEDHLALALSKNPLRTVLKSKNYPGLNKPIHVYKGQTVSYYIFK